MPKYMELSADDDAELCLVAKALSSTVRIDILKTLDKLSLNVNEISEVLKIPTSSAAMHIRILESAGLIKTEQQPGERGTMKLCSRKKDFVTIRLNNINPSSNKVETFSIPIGTYTDCEVTPTCGLGSAEDYIGNEDLRENFYRPDRINAQIIWTSAGFLEYKFSNTIPKSTPIKKITISMELCSEAPNFRENWKSDLTLWINDKDCGTWTSPGDFGERRGRITPSWVPYGSSQYGLLTSWKITKNGCFINEQPVGGTVISDLKIEDNYFIKMRIGNKPDAKYIGGFNIFGRYCGDYAQDIVVVVEY